MLRCLLPLASRVYTVTPDSPRALSGEVLCREAGRYHKQVAYAPTLKQALSQALEAAYRTEDSGEKPGENSGGGAEGCLDQEGKQPLILAFGSLSWLGGMKREMEAAVTRAAGTERRESGSV